MICPICSSPLSPIFKAMILSSLEITYFKCHLCGLIKTEEPYWFEDAYSEAIGDLDVGLVRRSMGLVPKVRYLIEKNFSSDGVFLDFAGGYGLFVRMMRDVGFNFYRQDKFCQNLFAKYFDYENCEIKNGFELITAFEFFEHVVDPLAELKSLLTLSDSVLFSTELQPDNIKNIGDWWYFVPEGGQHISFYTKQTFTYMAELLCLNYHTDGKSLHLLTKREINFFDFGMRTNYLPDRKNIFKKIVHFLKQKNCDQKRESLIQPDYQFIKKLMLNIK